MPSPKKLGTRRSSAQVAVEEIASERGFLSKEELDNIAAPGSENRIKLEKAFLAKDKFIGRSVLTLATNLYTSNARFVFELLQNADDNEYEKAKARGDKPEISFGVYSDRIIVECNEDGFTKENLVAISSIGETSKTGSNQQSYIGEKGIGFKSIFMVASKVHIKSNKFSFSFTHHQGDSGMGMITPVWEESKEEKGDSVTRMTLFLIQQTSAPRKRRQEEEIKEQFEDLHGTALLFLRNLRRVSISFHDPDDNLLSTIVHTRRDGDRTRIERSMTVLGESTPVRKDYYHVTRHTVHGLPASETRSYDDLETRPDSTSEVVLAFPISDASVPIVKNQDVFAFLPLRSMGFKFLMHADFVTEASRQGLVTTSRRNRSLREGIADCFVKAVEEMCQHRVLKFKWMRWLPQADSYPWDDFWVGFLSQIESRIMDASVLQSLGDERFDKISALRPLRPSMLDADKTPLFEDFPGGIYLHSGYGSGDLEILKPYGLTEISWEELVKLVKKDLRKSDRFSHMRSIDHEDGWHSRVANLLSSRIRNQAGKTIGKHLRELKKLKIIPLSTREWVSADDGPFYHPLSEGSIAIPPLEDLKIVHSLATKDGSRLKLFETLGLNEAPISLVQRKILDMPQSEKASSSTLKMSIQRLHYLYFSQGVSENCLVNPGELIEMVVYDQDMDARSPLQPYERVYMKTPHPYGAQETLLSVIADEESHNEHEDSPASAGDSDDGSLYTVSSRASSSQSDHSASEEPDSSSDNRYLFLSDFIHDDYLESPGQAPLQNLSWIQWLEHMLGVTDILQLTVSDDEQICTSDALEFVLDNRPEKLIGVLERCWPEQGEIIATEEDILQWIKSTKVPSLSGVPEQLDATFLPCPKLLACWARYAEDQDEGEYFPFLKLPEPITTGQDVAKWHFLLNAFDVRDNELDFQLSMLCYLEVKERDSTSETRFLPIYQTIQALGQMSDDRSQSWETVRKRMEDEDLVFIPSFECKEACKVAPSQCVWAGRPKITIYSLEAIYSSVFSLPEADLDNLRRFFKHVLQVPDTSWEHEMEELRFLMNPDNDDYTVDLTEVAEAYNFLYESWEIMSDEDQSHLRTSFTQERLIFVDEIQEGTGSCWSTIGECIWSSATRIEGRVALNELYPQLEEFFLRCLEVQELTLEMAFNELKRKGTLSPPPPVFEVKEAILVLNKLLESADPLEARSVDPKLLLSEPIFPVMRPDSGGVVALQAGSTPDFAIVDRSSLRNAFSAEAKFLDFSLEEVKQIDRFISWIGWDKYYLSAAVKEMSVVSADGAVSRLETPSRSIKAKAKGLYRLASHFGSPRIEQSGDELYHILRRAKTFETDCISSEIHLHQGDRVLKYVKEKSELHIREDEDGDLEVYVPRDRRRRGLCFGAALPSRLLQWLMTDPVTRVEEATPMKALLALTSIMTVPVGSVPDILDSHGIIDVVFPDDHDPDHSGGGEVENHGPEVSSEEQVEDDETGSHTHQVGVGEDDDEPQDNSSIYDPTPPSTPRRRRGDSRTTESGEELVVIESRSTALRRSPRSAPLSPLTVFDVPHGEADLQRALGSVAARAEPMPQEDYLRLLRHVVVGARSASFPRRNGNGSGVFGMGEMRASLEAGNDGRRDELGGEGGIRFHSRMPLERDMKIGAAGELYVFELLSQLNPHLPGFGRDNWQSKMRKFARTHPDYVDMAPWNRPESTDIVYSDRGGVFTKLLVDSGYLEQQQWRGKTPNYLIEVKTTTGQAHKAFYMSGNQFRLMQSFTNAAESADPSPTVYMILRVFNVDKRGVGLKVYLDPEKMRRDRALVFTEDVYSVVPGPGQN